MASIEELRVERLKKIGLLKEAGRAPYPNKIPRDFSLDHVRANFTALLEAKKEISIAGRVMVVRGQGAIQFVVLNDGTEKFQVVFKKDVIGDDEMAFFGSIIDVGDFISVTGELFTTQRGEESIMAKTWVMGAKSLLPLPEKWHGLQDEDEKLRKRYLDIMLDPELRELFVAKSGRSVSWSRATTRSSRSAASFAMKASAPNTRRTTRSSSSIGVMRTMKTVWNLSSACINTWRRKHLERFNLR